MDIPAIAMARYGLTSRKKFKTTMNTFQSQIEDGGSRIEDHLLTQSLEFNCRPILVLLYRYITNQVRRPS